MPAAPLYLVTCRNNNWVTCFFMYFNVAVAETAGLGSRGRAGQAPQPVACMSSLFYVFQSSVMPPWDYMIAEATEYGSSATLNISEKETPQALSC